jgi:hypothetical protein
MKGMKGSAWHGPFSMTFSPTQNNGRITQFTDNFSHQTVSYTYDTLNRLATSSSNAGWGVKPRDRPPVPSIPPLPVSRAGHPQNDR